MFLKEKNKIYPNLELEKKFLNKNGSNFFIGVDVVGRGSWAGPIVACACWINPENFEFLPQGINDSKKLSESKRLKIYNEVENLCLKGISISSTREIEKYGLKRSNDLAILRCTYVLTKYIKNYFTTNLLTNFKICVDGNFKISDIQEERIKLLLKDINVNNFQTIVKGDTKVLSISLASIIAKVTRDKLMMEYDKMYPGFCFFNNKGYGTKYHLKKIKTKGICRIHRKNFKPIFQHIVD